MDVAHERVLLSASADIALAERSLDTIDEAIDLLGRSRIRADRELELLRAARCLQDGRHDAAIAILAKLAWVSAPKWLSAVAGIALGWVAVVAFPQILDHAGVAAATLIAVGGVCYTAGGVIYARRKPDPVAALRNRLRRDIGRFPSLSPVAIETLRTQYREHPGWTAQLHFDNLRVVIKHADSPLPSYPTIRRYLKSQAKHRL